MTAGLETQTLLDPITDDRPCGDDLEDSPILTGLDSLRLFGQSRSPEAPPEADDGEKEKGRERPPPEWGQIKSTANEALARSKDLRVLTYLAAALLRTDGLPAFCETLTSRPRVDYWSGVYPPSTRTSRGETPERCGPDGGRRVWRTPLVASRQHGRFSLRDVDLATGHVPAGAHETKPDEGPINAAFAEMPVEELTGLEQTVSNGIAALNTIDGKMRSEGGPDVAPDFDALSRISSDETGMRRH
jgi:type VI secretion system protein ImpA